MFYRTQRPYRDGRSTYGGGAASVLTVGRPARRTVRPVATGRLTVTAASARAALVQSANCHPANGHP